jgi:hypothetical protein
MKVLINGSPVDAHTVEITYDGEEKEVGTLIYNFNDAGERRVFLIEDNIPVFERYDNHDDQLDELVKMMED